MPDRYFIVEHPTRGILVDIVMPDDPEALTELGRFRWSITRNHPDVLRYSTLEEAQRAVKRLPEPVQANVQIMKSPAGKGLPYEGVS